MYILEILRKLSVCLIQANERTFTTASTTSALAILASPKDLTLKEQILRLRDVLKLKNESKMKSNIFRDLDKMSCCECVYKYICVCVCASVPLRPAGRSHGAASCVEHKHEQESPFPPFPHVHLLVQSKTEALDFSLGSTGSSKPTSPPWRSNCSTRPQCPSPWGGNQCGMLPCSILETWFSA